MKGCVMVLIKRLLLVAAVTVVAASASPSASAIQVINEFTDVPCGQVQVNGHLVSQGGTLTCWMHIASTEVVDLEILGVTISSCNQELDMYLSGSGSGYIHRQSLTGENCTVVPCFELGGGVKPWPASLAESSGVFVLTYTFCVRRTDGSETNCTVSSPTTPLGHSGASFGGESPELNCAGTGGALQQHGAWTIEQDPEEGDYYDIEIVH